MMVYRESMVKAAGFDSFPKDTDGFLKHVQGGQGKGHAGRHGARQRDRRRPVVQLAGLGVRRQAGRQETTRSCIDSPETIKALEYGKELYATFIPGTLSWLDPSNNKAFLDGQISVTNNGISIYVAAKNSPDPKLKEMAADIQHAPFPVGPVGVPTESHLYFNQMIMKYTKYPQAAKEFLRFMMEQEQFDPWLTGAQGYVAPPLAAYAKSAIWTSDPKNTAYRDAVKNLRPAGYEGQLGYASAGAAADFIIVNMVAEAVSGAKTPKEAMERAQKRAERYYKV